MRKSLTLLIICFLFLPHSQAQFGKLGNYLTDVVLKGKAQTQLELGIKKFDEKDYEGALASFDYVVEKKPKENIGWRIRGFTKLSIGKSQAALADFDKALEIESWDYHSLYLRAMALISLGKPLVAAQDLYKCRSLAPNWESSYYGLALYHSQLLALDSSSFHLNKAIEINPAYQDAYIFRATVYFQENQFELASADYLKAMELGEVEPAIMLNYGVTTAQTGNFEEASRIAELLGNEFPGHPNVLYMQGGLLINQGEYQKGITMLETCCQDLRQLKLEGKIESPVVFNLRQRSDTLARTYSDDMMGGLFFIMGKAEEKLGNVRKAITNFDSALIYHKDLSILLEDKGRLHFDLQEWEKAEKTFEKCFRQEPENPVYIFSLGASYYAQEKFPLAFPLFEKLHNQHFSKEDFPDLHFYLIMCYYYLDMDEEFLSMLDQYSTEYKGEQKAELMFSAAFHYGSKGVWGEAEKYVSLAIEALPDFGLFYYYRGDIRKNTKNTQGALADYQKALKYGGDDPELIRELSYEIGMMYVNKADFEQACTYLTQAANLGKEQAIKYKASICK